MKLFLVAHKVRGEPALDVVGRMRCPLCFGEGCHECEDEGHWWIVPTSGHRAYPYAKLCSLDTADAPPMPPDARDHYQIHRGTEPSQRVTLNKILNTIGIKPPQPAATPGFVRRI